MQAIDHQISTLDGIDGLVRNLYRPVILERTGCQYLYTEQLALTSGPAIRIVGKHSALRVPLFYNLRAYLPCDPAYVEAEMQALIAAWNSLISSHA